jgi:uncharacterized membrane protein YphA (DoxX/SURF4 family)
MFPQGGPGFALLLLRLSVAALLLIEALYRSSSFPSYILVAGVVLISIFLIIGYLTPFISVLACISAVTALLTGFLPDRLALFCLAVNSVALALLGPGAYSLDARLFGRRTLVVPPPDDDPL